MSEVTHYAEPHSVEFWAAELFHKPPVVIPPRTRPKSDMQALWDVWHKLEDGIEHKSRREQRRRLKWMLKLELSMTIKICDSLLGEEDPDA